MRKIVGFLKWPLGFIVLLIAGLYLSGYGYIVKAVSMTYLSGKKGAAIDNYKGFDNRIVLSDRHLPWSEAQNYNELQMTERLKKEHKDFESIAYLVIQNDKVLYEEYWDDYNSKSLSNSFSMAKTIVSMLMQVAIQEGKIKSMDQAVGDFFPEFNKTELSKQLTVGDLSRMSSGLNWDESYSNPFSVTTKAYFGNELAKIILGLEVVEQPGKEYKYLSGNTQLLAMVIEKATGQKLSDYASEKLWKPMGASSDALWMIDEVGGLEKAYCCFNSNARDFARFGKLWLDHGNWNGKQIIDSSFVELSVKPYFKKTPFYGYSWWLDYTEFDTQVYFMRGILGQYVIVIPEYDLIIVRLGHKRDGKDDDKPHPRDFYVFVGETLKMLDLR
jgi:CubicO group peptidase (beta-lactamase class C family)